MLYKENPTDKAAIALFINQLVSDRLYATVSINQLLSDRWMKCYGMLRK